MKAKKSTEKQAAENRDEFMAILEEMESTDVEYKIRMAIHRLRKLADRLNEQEK